MPIIIAHKSFLGFRKGYFLKDDFLGQNEKNRTVIHNNIFVLNCFQVLQEPLISRLGYIELQQSK